MDGHWWEVNECGESQLRSLFTPQGWNLLKRKRNNQTMLNYKCLQQVRICINTSKLKVRLK